MTSVNTSLMSCNTKNEGSARYSRSGKKRGFRSDRPENRSLRELALSPFGLQLPCSLREPGRNLALPPFFASAGGPLPGSLRSPPCWVPAGPPPAVSSGPKSPASALRLPSQPPRHSRGQGSAALNSKIACSPGISGLRSPSPVVLRFAPSEAAKC